MSGKGGCRGHAVVARFFRSLDMECTNHCLYATRQAVKQDVIDYIEMFYNSHRLHRYLGYLSTNDYDARVLFKAT